MKILADTVPPAPAVDRRWLWVVRLALLAYLFVSLAAVPLMPAHLLDILPWVLPYLLALLGMQSERYREAALMLAVVIGALGMAVWLGVLCFAHVGPDGGLPWGSVDSVILGLQAAISLLVFLSAHQALRKRTLGVRAVRGAGQLVVVCALVLAGVIVTLPHEVGEVSRGEAWAVRSLRSLNVAEVTYANIYKKGFARTLADLVQPPQGYDARDWIDPDLAAGQMRGYRFVLIPGPPDQAGAVTNYRIVARPLQYGKTGVRSFYTDESAVIRATTENRVATAQDPPL